MSANKKSKLLSPYKKKESKFKNRLTPALAAVSSIALAGLTGLAARKIIKNNDKAKIQEIDPQQLQKSACEEKMKILNNSLEEEIQKLKEQIKKEQEANIQLVDQINRCNKEVVRQSKIISLKPNLLKEATLRSEINRLSDTLKKISK
jgi:uncharacterized membrane protein YraQ (UPF0718 family)